MTIRNASIRDNTGLIEEYKYLLAEDGKHLENGSIKTYDVLTKAEEINQWFEVEGEIE